MPFCLLLPFVDCVCLLFVLFVGVVVCSLLFVVCCWLMCVRGLSLVCGVCSLLLLIICYVLYVGACRSWFVVVVGSCRCVLFVVGVWRLFGV